MQQNKLCDAGLTWFASRTTKSTALTLPPQLGPGQQRAGGLRISTASWLGDTPPQHPGVPSQLELERFCLKPLQTDSQLDSVQTS
ncbi:unnamed protein product [Arctogadus glacialis]